MALALTATAFGSTSFGSTPSGSAAFGSTPSGSAAFGSAALGSAHRGGFAAAVTFYVDATGGNDANAGTSSAAPWKSLAKVNATTFHAGDQILLKAGQVWSGQLWPKGSGATGSPIVLGAYGSGARPRIDGASRVTSTVKLHNQQYWEIRGLEITNIAPATGTPGANLKDLRGIHIDGDNGQTLNHLYVDGVYVHDVSGQVNWIGGDTTGNAPGVTFQTGWDRSKKTGGIVFDTTVPDIAAPGTAPTILNDLLVQNSTISDTSFAGIVVKQYSGDAPGATATGWGNRSSASDPAFHPHTNVVIRNNYISQANTAYGCNGVYLTDVRGGVVTGNTIYQAGTSGIEAYFADSVTIQHNEIYQTSKKAGGADYNGIDPDKATTNMLVQYNFVHDNGDGILLCQFSFGSVTVRYNVLKSNTRYPIYLHSDKAATADIYNNTVYNDVSGYLTYGYGSSLSAKYTIRNNIYCSTKANAVLTTSSTITYGNNLYAGTLTIPSSDTTPKTGDPHFVNENVSGPYGTPTSGPQLATARAYALTPGSAAINTGLTISANGGLDYAGAPLYNGAPDIGALEYES
ncbi:right-handed parallel beta-helix repeat-containing protein [Actinoplanes subtropicus]|uniref:right-handed parallel beta-helix repeat-containing protein n=1 Tax=Actinoplanes subtropicus TaxID=543632 RepID=UPI001B807AD7|nr:right-handed parallel beta-helix repeat-containing protein [Actinoplanes subtropicus]